VQLKNLCLMKSLEELKKDGERNSYELNKICNLLNELRNLKNFNYCTYFRFSFPILVSLVFESNFSQMFEQLIMGKPVNFQRITKNKS
jgi:hypothetical protein